MPRYRVILGLLMLFSANWINAAAVLTVAIGSSPNNLDPYFATDANSQDLNRLIHLSLVDTAPDMSTVCRACEKYEETRLDSGEHRLRFWLKPDIRFQDGTQVKAQNVVESVSNLLKQESAPIPNLFNELKGAVEINAKTVELIFSAYRPENLTNLSLLKIEKFDNGKRITAGKFRLLEKSDSTIIIEDKNQKIVFKVVGDETTMALKIINKEIDLIATTISPRKTEWLSKQKKLKVFEKEGTNYVYISPQHRHPDLKSSLVRKALSHLIPRKKLATFKQKNTVVLAEGMFSSAFAQLHLKKPPISYDPELSRQLLQKDGYTFASGRWSKDGRILELTLKISNKKHIIELAKALVPYFEQIGIPLRVQPAEWGTFYRDLKAGNFDLALGQWIGFVGADQMGFTFLKESFPPGGANRGYYFDTQFEKNYSKALDEKNKSLRDKYYRQAYARLIEDEAYISLWHPKIMWIASECVKKINLYPTGNFLAFEDMEHTCQR